MRARGAGGHDRPDEQRRLIHTGTDNMEAYDYFLRGRDQFGLQSKEGNVRAKAMFQRAIELDPGLALGYAFLARVHLNDYVNRWDVSTSRSLEQAYDLSKKAVALDETCPLAHVGLGGAYLWRKQHDDAIAVLERAIALDPNLANGYALLGWVLHYAGRSEDGIEMINRGVLNDPFFPDIYLH